MDYIAPLNAPATPENPRPDYFDGNLAAGQRGAWPSGKVFEVVLKELLALIEGAGLTPSHSDLTQVRQAVQQMINAAIEGIEPGEGGGTPASFLLNPVFPHVTVNGGVISTSVSNGQVVVNEGQTFIHRGGTLYNLNDFNLAARTFPTVAGKTYHLRWRYNAGSPTLSLIDVTDGGYNPGGKAESHPDFDTAYDDALFQRVVTDGANNPTVTALKNLAVLKASPEKTTIEYSTNASIYTTNRLVGTLNWGRTPMSAVQSFNNDATTDLDATYIIENAVTRYGYNGVALGYSGGLGQYYSSGRLKLAIWA